MKNENIDNYCQNDEWNYYDQDQFCYIHSVPSYFVYLQLKNYTKIICFLPTLYTLQIGEIQIIGFYLVFSFQVENNWECILAFGIVLEW